MEGDDDRKRDLEQIAAVAGLVAGVIHSTRELKVSLRNVYTGIALGALGHLIQCEHKSMAIAAAMMGRCMESALDLLKPIQDDVPPTSKCSPGAN